MRRRPQEDDEEQDQRHRGDRAGDGGPADQRRERAGRAADDDVLRRPPLQPHRVDEDVERDRGGEQSGGDQIRRQPHHHDRADRQRDAVGQRRIRRDPPGRDWPVAGAAHLGVDVAVVPHVDGTRRARRDGDAQHGGEGEHRMQMAGRDQQADDAGEHHQGQHARLEQHEPVAQRRLGWAMATAGSSRAVGSFIRSAGDARQLGEGVVRRRGADGPFQRRRTLAPVVVGNLHLGGEDAIADIQEHQRADAGDVGADRGDEVPAGEGVRIVGVAARHAGQAEEMLREEGQVHADEGEPEMDACRGFRVLVAGHLADPVVEAGEDREDRAQRQHVVEMRHHVVGVVDDLVDAGIGQHHAGHAADGEQEDEADRPHHRHFERDRAAPHRGDPGEHLDAGRHRDDQRRRHEVGAGVDADAGDEHVVRPHHEADHADRHHRVDHAEVAEDRLAAEGGDDVADDPEAGQDHDVDFRVAEEPEQMLEQHRIAAAGGVEEGGAEIAVGDQHGDGAGQHRDRQQQQERRHQHRPDEQRHAVQRHAGRAHVEDRGDEVDGAEQRADAGQMQREQRAVHAGAGLEGGVGQRRIQRPAGAGFTHQQAGQDQHEGRGQQPEADVVEAREGHVRRADHQRDEPVAEAADQRGHDREEDHDQAVRRDDGVPFLPGRDERVARGLQLRPHDDRTAAGRPCRRRPRRADRACRCPCGSC